jgi:hypothetical protein
VNFYYFDNSEGARCVMVMARSAKHAWKKLQRTHEYYFHRNGWSMRKREGKL